MSASSASRRRRPLLARALPWGGALVLVALVSLVVWAMTRGTVLTVSGDLWAVAATAGLVLIVVVAVLVGVVSRTRRLVSAARREAAQVAAEEARNRHRQFLRRLDHELKNPLTAVRAAADVGEQNVPAPVRGGLEVIDAQSRRMSRLLTDLRKLAELETSPLNMEPVDVVETVQDAVDAVIEEAAGRGAPVRVRLNMPQVPWPLPQVMADGDLLYSAVYNVISNAAKYTPSGGVVEVSGREESGTVTIEVADTGIGVPQDELDLVFTELGRASNAHGLPGSGLGLALVRTIMERHGGSASMASRQAWARGSC
ncbi:sensor histidine kinase [Actinomyces respiraculi]|uniref:sensor histidine kinase n=1 Tax=Actinomyces respiraculi TaxID=2744574 RepID=UPI001FD5E114|nr:HAMP domain-containing sensor histidine kinase [Actinomyces respiraculi]